MRVLHIITGLDIGGAEAILFKLCQSSNKDNHAVISLLDEGKYGPMLKDIGVEVYALNFSYKKLNFLAFLRLIKLIRQIMPDVVQTWMMHANAVGGIAAKLAGIKNIFWGVHQTILIKGKSKTSAIMLVKLNAILSNLIPIKIIYCAKKSKEVHELIGFKKSKGVVIQNGYDLKSFYQNDSLRKDFRDKLNIPLEKFIIGHVGSYDPFKDQNTLIKSLTDLLDRRIKFSAILVGKNLDNLNHDLFSLLKRNELLDHVYLLGERDDILSVMNAIDIFLLSSISEAFPNVLNEAMACGTPCLATDVGDCGFIVGNTGWIVQPKDSKAMADACAQAFNEKEQNNDHWKKRKEACRERIIENFNFEKMLNKYKDVWAHDV